MAIPIRIQYNGGFIPDIILLTECYYHRRTDLMSYKRFCLFSACSHLINVFTIIPLVWGMLRRFRCVQIFLEVQDWNSSERCVPMKEGNTTRTWCLLIHGHRSLGIKRYGCQSFSWSARQRNCFFPRSPFAPKNWVARQRGFWPSPSRGQPTRSARRGWTYFRISRPLQPDVYTTERVGTGIVGTIGYVVLPTGVSTDVSRDIV